MTGDDRVTSVLEWEGISIEVSFNPNSFFGFAHLELRSRGKVKLPVTETGYRSHFLPPGFLSGAAEVLSFVREWLDVEAKKPEWRETHAADQQLSLF